MYVSPEYLFDEGVNTNTFEFTKMYLGSDLNTGKVNSVRPVTNHRSP